MTIAITRDVSPRMNECELTHIERIPIDVNIARQQHHDYIEALKSLGCEVIALPAEADLPDSVFVEDAALILPEIALIARPGADSRKLEVNSIMKALAPYRPMLRITAPATLDGGDVLVVGRNIYVGLSTRSNEMAIRQMQELLGNYGYSVTGVQLRDCLHLKTAVTRADDKTLLINRNLVDVRHFESYDLIDVDASEPLAANCLPIGDFIIFPAAFPKTRARLEAKGCKIKAVRVDELAKAEGAVTCCSLIID